MNDKPSKYDDPCVLGPSGPLFTVEQMKEAVDKIRQKHANYILMQKYNPPSLFIFEEVEVGGGYHTLSICNSGPESDWSEAYKKSGSSFYKSRVVLVPFPPQ